MSGYDAGEVRLVEAIRNYLGEEQFRELLRCSFKQPYQDGDGLWCFDHGGFTWFMAEGRLCCKTVNDGFLFVGVTRGGHVYWKEPIPLDPI